MKKLSKFKLDLMNMKQVTKRFPITILVSLCFALMIIYLNEATVVEPMKTKLENITAVLLLGIPLFGIIEILIEKYKTKIHFTIPYLLGSGFLFFYYHYLIDQLGSSIVPSYRFAGTIILLIICFLYMQKISNSKDYEYYYMDVSSIFSLTFIYAFVLYIGIVGIFFTIDQLFDVNIRFDFYFYTFLLVTFGFGTSFFLSKFPTLDEKYTNVEYPRSLKVLLLYIVIPLISIYTTILYVYFLKIIITQVWPKGMVSHLVLWYSLISVGVVFLLTPLDKAGNKTANFFRRIFPKSIIPVLVMMFLAIYQRVNQYGITENRFYVMALALWVFGIFIAYALKRNLKNIIVPISLSIVVLFSIYGPLNGFEVSKRSQNHRLETILMENNMISNGEIVSNSDIDENSKKQIGNIVGYFQQKHKIEDIDILSEGFNIEKFSDVFGFKYTPYSTIEREYKYFYYNLKDNNPIIDISNYDYYLNVNSWGEKSFSIEAYRIEFDRETSVLTIFENERIILEQDLNNQVKTISDKYKNANKDNNNLSVEEMTFILPVNTNENIEAKLIFTEINGTIEYSGNLSTESLQFILLVNNKSN